MQEKLPEALCELYREVDDLKRSSHAAPFVYARPRIGVSVNQNSDYGSTIVVPYTDAVIKGGGLPIVIPVTNDYAVLRSILESCDGLLMSGGDDINPMFLDEDPIAQLDSVNTHRDRYDLALLRIAHSLCMPVMGICRGEQLMGVAFGSGLYQDIYSQRVGEMTLGHNPKIRRTETAHRIYVNPDSRLAKIFWENGSDSYETRVNSVHHQALSEAKYPFKVCASAPDGIIEAIDAYPEVNMLGVQWHPERLVCGGVEEQEKLFAFLVSEAQLYHRARMFHRHHITLDSHTDTPMTFTPSFNFGSETNSLVDLPKMQRGELTAVCMAAYIPQQKTDAEGIATARTKTLDILNEMQRQVEMNTMQCVWATSPQAVCDAFVEGRKAIIPAVENGYGIDDLATLHELHRRGVAYITLCHNGDNHLCDSARHSKQTHQGLSDWGREVVREMNRLGIMIDLSHTAPKTVTDVLAITTRPVIASHASAYALCAHERNLTDEQICAIAQTGGVVQVCMYAGFIYGDDAQASLLDAVRHIVHIKELVGIDHVGIGSDFDGDGELIGCRHAAELVRMTIELLRVGFTEEDLVKLWGGNFLRVWQENQHASGCSVPE